MRTLETKWQIANEAPSAEVAIIISSPTSASGIIENNHEKSLSPANLVIFPFPPEACSYHICGAWYNGSYTMATRPIKTQKLRYPMITVFFFFNKTCGG